ncbi:MAG: nucleoside hydrolase [Planctomycetes bacterium]|nr:nucleoside hydrolase [Planctomycetota bacterium]
MTQKLIIDADPGIGDAVAIALALLDPDLDVVAVTATSGCVSGKDATRNIQTIIEMLDPPKWPRLGGSDVPIAPQIRETKAAAKSFVSMNGPNGLGDLEFRVADLHSVRESAKVMIDAVRDRPYEITLLTLGPLTNVELACERAPDFLDLLKGLICLGGTVESGGDVTATAEFNIYANPEAARNVLLSPATKTLVPLDISSKLILTFEQFDRLSGSAGSSIGRFLSQLLPYAFRAYHEQLGLEGICLQEVTALAAIAIPRLFESHSMAVNIETQGELTRGMTVFDRRGVEQWQTNIDVFSDVDTQGVLDYFNRVVRRAT